MSLRAVYHCMGRVEASPSEGAESAARAVFETLADLGFTTVGAWVAALDNGYPAGGPSKVKLGAPACSAFWTATQAPGA